MRLDWGPPEAFRCTDQVYLSSPDDNSPTTARSTKVNRRPRDPKKDTPRESHGRRCSRSRGVSGILSTMHGHILRSPSSAPARTWTCHGQTSRWLTRHSHSVVRTSVFTCSQCSLLALIHPGLVRIRIRSLGAESGASETSREGSELSTDDPGSIGLSAQNLRSPRRSNARSPH